MRYPKLEFLNLKNTLFNYIVQHKLDQLFADDREILKLWMKLSEEFCRLY